MTEDRINFMYLAGSGGGDESGLLRFAAGLDVPFHIDPVRYPDWKRYIKGGYSAEKLVEELADEMVRRSPEGPISILGVSIGGHFGYAVALSLQRRGREVALLCAIDSFVPASVQPSSGWKGRNASQMRELLQKARVGEIAMFFRFRAWRTLFRLMERRSPRLRRRIASKNGLLSFLLADPVAARELNAMLLLRKAIPWIQALDRAPAPMTAPTLFLRTVTSARDDAAWQNRCPHIAIREIPGMHHSLFEPENVVGLRAAFSSAVDEFRVKR